MSHNRIGGRELSHNHMLERPIISRDRRSSVIIETQEHVIMRLFEAKMRFWHSHRELFTASEIRVEL